jgi:predicted alpha/beta hydrolase family esterase
MENIAGFPFVALEFDKEGALTTAASKAELAGYIRAETPSDLIIIAHGWRNSAHDARELYAEFLGTLRANIDHTGVSAALAARHFVVAGVLWPSKPFPEQEEDGGSGGAVGIEDPADEEAEVQRQLDALDEEETCEEQRRAIASARALLPRLETSKVAQDEFVKHLMVLLEDAEPDPNEGLDRVKATPGHELLQKLAGPIVVPTAAEEIGGGALGVPDVFDNDGTAAGFGDAVTSIWHRVGRVLNYTTWYLMKDRSGTVGAEGVAPLVRELAAAASALRVHLVGHSLGGRLVVSAAKALAAPPPQKIATLTLLQAAFSHYGLAENNGEGIAGFFRDVISRQVVAGPILATYSRNDRVVGKTYALASRLAGDNLKEIGDANDPYGGIGRNGAQRTAERVLLELASPGHAYAWTPGRVYNLRGDDFIANHSDVKGKEITYAFASAVASV